MVGEGRPSTTLLMHKGKSWILGLRRGLRGRVIVNARSILMSSMSCRGSISTGPSTLSKRSCVHTPEKRRQHPIHECRTECVHPATLVVGVEDQGIIHREHGASGCAVDVSAWRPYLAGRRCRSRPAEHGSALRPLMLRFGYYGSTSVFVWTARPVTPVDRLVLAPSSASASAADWVSSASRAWRASG